MPGAPTVGAPRESAFVPERLALDDVVAVTDHRLAVVCPEATPARPEHDREDGADNPHDHEDHADGLDVDAGDVRAHRPGEDRTGGDQDQTESDAHEVLPLRENAVPPFGRVARGRRSGCTRVRPGLTLAATPEPEAGGDVCSGRAPGKERGHGKTGDVAPVATVSRRALARDR